MENIKQYNEIAFPLLNDSQKAPITQATNIVASYSGEEFENFILEWLKYCCKKINESTVIGRIGGTGDNGIDIYENTNGKISYYQCKRYTSALTRPQFIEIIIKVLWHCFKSDIEKPEKLYIIAFKGVNGQVLPLLAKNQMATLKDSIITGAPKALSDLKFSDDAEPFISYLKKITDYSFVEKIDLDDIVKEYCLSEYKMFRFITTSPSHITRKEIQKGNYEENIFYKQLANIVTRNKNKVLLKAKEQYYSALCLEETDKYLLGSNAEFKKLEQEVSSNIDPVRNQHFDDMFNRYNQIVASAMATLTSNVALDYSLHMVQADDKVGICHKFVNENTLSWEEEDE